MKKEKQWERNTVQQKGIHEKKKNKKQLPGKWKGRRGRERQEKEKENGITNFQEQIRSTIEIRELRKRDTKRVNTRGEKEATVGKGKKKEKETAKKKKEEYNRCRKIRSKTSRIPRQAKQDK